MGLSSYVRELIVSWGFSCITRADPVNGLPEFLTKEDGVRTEALPQGYHGGLHGRDGHPGAGDIDRVGWVGCIPTKKTA